jgi:exopolyphosphatase/guanosine-5'-triphosphate,3'-diphosphate pyrophosphatase
MPGITPRWEWRAFGRHFGEAESQLRALTPHVEQESEEVYVLASPDVNVKLRDGQVDIKELRQVDAHGLEQWVPVRKEACTLDRFMAEFAGAGKTRRPVRVHKRRRRYTLGGCLAELVDVEANGRSTRTIALESKDASQVVRAIGQLGLVGYANVSYPRGLGMLIGEEPARYAVIDVGTNSVKLHIGERDLDRRWRAVVDRAEVTRLGEGLALNGVVADAALGRTAAAIARMTAEAKQHGVLAIVAVGTAGLRMASNRDHAVAAIEGRAGVHVEVISGEEEGRLAYLAARSGLGQPQGSLVVFDSGGGSTQFTFGHDQSVDERFSLNVGAARYTERFRLDAVVSLDVLREAMAAIASDLSRIDGRPVPDALVAMGGSVTNIAAVRHGLARYDPVSVDGTVLECAELDRQIELYRSRAADDRRAIIGLQPQRAEVILAGACIIRTIMETLGRHTLTVSDRGLRHGVLADRFA